jgi:hypothetical protein
MRMIRLLIHAMQKAIAQSVCGLVRLGMLTDIFAHRYENVPIRRTFEERDRRLMVQLYRLLEEGVAR